MISYYLKSEYIHISRFFTILILCIIAQTGISQYAIEGHYHRGFLLPHRQNMLHLPKGPAHALEIRLLKKTDGSERWHRLYNNPDVGITIRGFDLANKNILGYGLGVAGFISSPIIQSRKFIWSFEMGAGIGFTTKKFDFEDNYKNIAIGSSINAYLLLGQKISFKLSKRMLLSTYMSFNHLSNASFALPNLGLNYPMISLGLQTYLTDANVIEPIPKDSGKVKGYWDMSSSFGLKEVYEPRKTKFGTFNISAQRAFGIGKKSSLSSGIDVFYNSSLSAVREAKGDTVSSLDIIQSGIRIGYQIHIEELVVSLNLGIYILDSYKGDGFMYHRISTRYYFTKHWGTNLSLKTHFFKADFIELGAAYRF